MPTQSGEKPTFCPRPIFSIQQNTQPLGHRLEAVLRIRLAFGTSKMRSQNQLGAVTQSVLDGRQRLADTRVIRHASTIKGNVKIHPHQDAVII